MNNNRVKTMKALDAELYKTERSAFGDPTDHFEYKNTRKTTKISLFDDSKLTNTEIIILKITLNNRGIICFQ